MREIGRRLNGSVATMREIGRRLNGNVATMREIGRRLNGSVEMGEEFHRNALRNGWQTPSLYTDIIFRR